MSGSDSKGCDESTKAHEIVGRCFECDSPYEEVLGSTICTVCRDVSVICDAYRSKLKEYHCRRHAEWTLCYFTFLEVFSREE
jgi:hypothetical protein